MISSVYLHIGKLYSIFHFSDVSSLCHLQNAVFRRFGIPIKEQIICFQNRILTNLLYYQLYVNQSNQTDDDGDKHAQDSCGDEDVIHFVLLGKDHQITVQQQRTEAVSLDKSFLIRRNINNIMKCDPDTTSTVIDATNQLLFLQINHKPNEGIFMHQKFFALYRDIIILHPLCLLIDLVLDLKNVVHQEEFMLDIVTKFSDQQIMNKDRFSLNCFKHLNCLAKIDALNVQIRENLIGNFHMNPVTEDMISMDKIATSIYGNPTVFKYIVNGDSSFVVLLHKGSTIFENFSKACIHEVYMNMAKDKILFVAKSHRPKESIPERLERITVQFLTFQITIDLGKEQEMKTVECIKRYIWKMKEIPLTSLKLYHEKIELEDHWELSIWTVSEITLNAIVEKPKRIILNLFGNRGKKGEILFRDRCVGMLETDTILDLKNAISDQYSVSASDLTIDDDKYADSCPLWETGLSDVYVAWNGSYAVERFSPSPVNIQDNRHAKKCTII